MNSKPIVSVIAPAYNAADFYAGWLHNIIEQDFVGIEVILVDDGSTDELPRLARTAPAFVRYVRQENRGPANARNTGIAVSRGEFLAFLDLDDRWTSGHLRRLSRALADEPRAGIAQGLIRNVIRSADGESHFCSRAYRFVNLGSSVYRRWVFEKSGLFDEALRYAEDFDFMIRCWENGVVKVDVDELSLLYHRHDRNMTNGKTVIDLGGVRIYKRHLDRVRAGQVDVKLPSRLGMSYPEYIGRSVIPYDEGQRDPVTCSESLPQNS